MNYYLGAKVEGRHTGDFLLSEGAGSISRETITVGQSDKVSVGTVLGQKTSDGKYFPLDPAASDGTQTPAGVLFNNVDAENGDVTAVIIACIAELNTHQIVWPGTITEPQKTAAIQALRSLFIVLR